MIDPHTRHYLRMMTAKAADACVVQRVVGVNLNNEDGSSRQRYIRRCKPLDRLKLVSAPRVTDPEAVGVANGKGRLLGYLDRRCGIETMKALRAGTRFEAVVAAVWQDPNGQYCLVIAIFHLKAEYQNLRQAEVAQSAASDQVRSASVVQRWNLGMLMGTLLAGEEDNPEPVLTSV